MSTIPDNHDLQNLTLTGTYTFTISEASFRLFHKYLGTYRLPGDKPLIHKGKKP